MQQAYYQANEMIMQASEEADRMRKQAQEEADQIRTGALAYSNDVLSEVEKVLASAYDTAVSRYDGFIGTLKENLEVVNSNKRELNEQLYPQTNTQEPEQEYNDEADFNFDENTFLEDID